MAGWTASPMREAEAELDTLRQFITENVVLSAAGAVLGLWLARAGCC